MVGEVTLDDLRRQRFCMYDDLYQQLLFERLQYFCGPLDLVLKTDDHWAIVKGVTDLDLVCQGRSAQGHFYREETGDAISTARIAHLINGRISLGWLSNPRMHTSDVAKTLMADNTAELSQGQ